MTSVRFPGDAEKKHRWLTEAELQALLEDAWHRGAAAMKRDVWEAIVVPSAIAAEIIVTTPAPEYSATRDDRVRMGGPKWWSK